MQIFHGSLFVAMDMIEIIDSTLDVGEVSISVGRNFILSILNRSNPYFLDVQDRCEREPEFLRLGALFRTKDSARGRG